MQLRDANEPRSSIARSASTTKGTPDPGAVARRTGSGVSSFQATHGLPLQAPPTGSTRPASPSRNFRMTPRNRTHPVPVTGRRRRDGRDREPSRDRRLHRRQQRPSRLRVPGGCAQRCLAELRGRSGRAIKMGRFGQHPFRSVRDGEHSVVTWTGQALYLRRRGESQERPRP